MNMNVLFDGNYLFHKTFSIFSLYYKNQDINTVLQSEENKQILIRKCIIDMCHTLSRVQDVSKVIFVFDSSSWRYKLYDDYKYALTKVRDESYQSFLAMLNAFETLLRKKGVIVSRVDGAEGDDLLYVWSLYYSYYLNEPVLIITGDSDIQQIMSADVALFNNNSKNLKLYCVPGRDTYWSACIDTEDVQVITVKPFNVLLRKVILGDKSDNISQLKPFFGQKSFDKFIEAIRDDKPDVNISLIQMAEWITTRFADYAKMDYSELFDKVVFNLKMTWLNLSTYDAVNFICKNGNELIHNILDDVNRQKDKYNYDKKYTLEDFYGMIIK